MESNGRRKVRIGIIGTGQIGTHHLDIYSHMPDVEVVAACDIDEPKLKSKAAQFHIPNLYTNFRELLQRDDIESVDVCLHNNLHAPVTIAALEAGKHVYCEKPMAGAYHDALAMYETAKRTGRRLNIQLNTLVSKETRAAKELIDAGQLGKLYHARSIGHRRRGRPYVDGYGSINFVRKEMSAGGAMYDMGVYHIAAILYLLGNPKVQRVSGKTYQEMPMDEPRRLESHYSVEELGLGFVRLENNLSIDIIEAWAIQADRFEGSMIFGSQGGLRLEPFGFFSSVCDVDLNAAVDLDSYLRRKVLMDPNEDVNQNAQRHWIASLQGVVPQLPSAELALNTMFISQGIYLSEQLGREVTAEEIVELTKSTAIKL
jgi:predicted dehydrogenase